MFFILAVETLQVLIENYQHVLIQTPKSRIELLQFADNTILFTPAHSNNLSIIRRLLTDFTNTTGLHIDYHKSGFIPIIIPQHNIATIASISDRLLTITTSIKYLGLPLTHQKPTKDLFDPMLNAIHVKIERLNGPTLSMTGRIVIVNAVLNALPIYCMQVFRLLEGVIDRIISCTRRFL
jgi:hypothetical protein